MNCLCCDSEMTYYFSKSYSTSFVRELMREIDLVEYFRCSKCGFVGSKTHQELARSDWEQLNIDYHEKVNSLRYNDKPTGSPPYAEQALCLR